MDAEKSTQDQPAYGSHIMARIGIGLAATAGATAVLVGLGFLIDLTVQDYLGVHLRTLNSPPHYVGIAGRFYLDTVSAVVGAVGASILTFAFTAIIIGLVWAFMRRPGPPDRLRQLADRFGGLALAVALLLSFFLFVLPLSHVRGILNRAPTVPDAVGLPYSAPAITYVWTKTVCSRLPMTLHDTARNQGIDCGSRDRLAHYGGLQRIYAVNFALLLLSALIIYFKLRTRHTPRLGWIVAVIALGLHVMFFPITYVRTVRSTVTNEIIVRIPDGPDRVASEHGFFIDAREGDLIMLQKIGGHIWFVPLERIERVIVEQSGDMLEHRFLITLEPSPSPPPIIP